MNVPQGDRADSAPLGIGFLPSPHEMQSDYDAADPDPRQQASMMHTLVDHRDWAKLSWQDLCDDLLALGRTDIVLSRLAEGHIDALRILNQADTAPQPDALYGVWASRSHATGVAAQWSDDALVIDGTIRFASGTGVIDRALVPVWVDTTTHYLVDIDVRDLPQVAPFWASDAMSASRSHTLGLENRTVPRSAIVGEANFYLERTGFFPGGVGVAAVWAGGSARVLDLCRAQLERAPESADRERRMGQMSTNLSVAVALVRYAGIRLDELTGWDWRGGNPQDLLRALATEVRCGVADAVGRVIADARTTAGPAGLAYDASLSRTLPDLELYILQRNLDADTSWLGRRLLGRDD